METYNTSFSYQGQASQTKQIVASGRFTVKEALKIYANVFKGRPPLKPNKGNNGYISWLSGKGSPNSGASAKPIELNFTWTHNSSIDVTTSNQKLLELYNLQEPNTVSVIQQNRQTWVAAGRVVENMMGIVELSVPTHQYLNSSPKHTPGSFYLINERNAHRVTLIDNLADLKNILISKGAQVGEWEIKYGEKNVACAGPDHPAYVCIKDSAYSTLEWHVISICNKYELKITGTQNWSLQTGENPNTYDDYIAIEVYSHRYAEFKLAAKELMTNTNLIFFPPYDFPKNWPNVKSKGSGGLGFNVNISNFNF